MIIAASMYSSMLGLSGVPSELQTWVVSSGLGLVALILVYVLIVIVLGTLLDSVSIILIVLPVFLPHLQHFSVDMIWFGVLSIIVVEIGLLTPPLGTAVFVVKSCLPNEQITLKDIFLGALPFGMIMLLVACLFPCFRRWLSTETPAQKPAIHEIIRLRSNTQPGPRQVISSSRRTASDTRLLAGTDWATLPI